MRKSDKKIDKQIRSLLTHFCENTLKQYNGFNWLTHTVNYNNFPQSLHITCVFQDSEHLLQFTQVNQQEVDEQLAKLINNMGINTRLIKQLVSYSTVNKTN